MNFVVGVAAAPQSPGAVKSQLAAALKLVKAIAKSDAGAIFAAPVTLDDAPDYFDIVKKPMDLGTIAAQLQAGAYSNAGMVLLCTGLKISLMGFGFG